MQRQTALNLIFNAVGIGLGLVLVVYVLNTAFVKEEVPSCAKTYAGAMRFPLTSPDGALLSKIDRQARAGSNEWGTIENTSVVADGPRKAALEVRLNPVETRAGSQSGRANGVEFRWNAPGFEKATSACLSYSVWLPEKFSFERGGILPGIYGAPADVVGEPAQADRFGTRITWRPDGLAELEAESQGAGFRAPAQQAFPVPVGRWTRLDQEIVLNKDGAANGAARLWVDGELTADLGNLMLRKDDSGRLAGVLADIGYLNEPQPGQQSMLRISPFELSWR
jgi:hypothetical protein